MILNEKGRHLSRVSIFGSCITRDVFRLFPGDAEVASYHSRSSLISLMSPPLEIDDTGTAWPSNFARKVVLADVRKLFFEDLEAAAPDVLIIDLMSERFDLLRARETYVTRSWELVSSALAARSGYRFQRVARETQAMHQTWLEQSRRFADVLESRFSELPVILHKAYWTHRYREGTGIRRFPREWRSWTSRRNAMLDAFHEHLERVLPRLAVVEARKAYVADPDHRWGLGASHYEGAYYEDVREQMLSRTSLVTA
jgi:Family of unknown function (DUF6270)